MRVFLEFGVRKKSLCYLVVVADGLYVLDVYAFEIERCFLLMNLDAVKDNVDPVAPVAIIAYG